MKVGSRRLIVVADRVLVRPEEGEGLTNTGLILPASVADRESVQTGRVVAIGPGHPLPPTGLEQLDDDWKGPGQPRYVAMQARPGDLAVYYRKAAVGISIDGEKLAVVGHGAILVLLRDELELQAADPSIN